MSLRSLIQLRGFLQDIPGGNKNINPSDLQNNTPPSVEIQFTLASGDNVISIPTLAIGCVIIPDPTSTTVKKLKGNAGDTGVILSKNFWNVITFDSPPVASFLINSSAADTNKLTSFIFF